MQFIEYLSAELLGKVLQSWGLCRRLRCCTSVKARAQRSKILLTWHCNAKVKSSFCWLRAHHKAKLHGLASELQQYYIAATAYRGKIGGSWCVVKLRILPTAMSHVVIGCRDCKSSSRRSTSARQVKRVLLSLYSASVLRSRAQSSPCTDIAIISCIAISATIYAQRSGSVGVIISVLFSVISILMVVTPQSVPTAPTTSYGENVAKTLGLPFQEALIAEDLAQPSWDWRERKNNGDHS